MVKMIKEHPMRNILIDIVFACAFGALIGALIALGF